MRRRIPPPAAFTVTPVPAAAPLLRYEANVTSDRGEDGVIRHALEVIGAGVGWCCEFGAWDGHHASNTWSLIHEHGYRGVLIECDPVRFAALRDLHAGGEKVTVLDRIVGWEGPDRLDALLRGTPIPQDFEVLSIDIDGNDYHVWEALRDYRPKVVVCEYNQTIPNEIDFVQARDPRVAQGASLAALDRLARAKGYRLIHATVTNGIFVREEDFPRFGIPDGPPGALRSDVSQVTWMFQTYDGRLHYAGFDRARWHGAPLSPRRLQTVPLPLRGFAPNFTGARASLWRLWRAARDPRGALGRLARRRA
jgi:hypothetical protein